MKLEDCSKDVEKALNFCVRKLGKSDRKLIELVRAKRSPYEIGAELHIPIGLVGPTLRMALANLREIFRNPPEDAPKDTKYYWFWALEHHLQLLPPKPPKEEREAVLIDKAKASRDRKAEKAYGKLFTREENWKYIVGCIQNELIERGFANNVDDDELEDVAKDIALGLNSFHKVNKSKNGDGDEDGDTLGEIVVSVYDKTWEKFAEYDPSRSFKKWAAGFGRKLARQFVEHKYDSIKDRKGNFFKESTFGTLGYYAQMSEEDGEEKNPPYHMRLGGGSSGDQPLMDNESSDYSDPLDLILGDPQRDPIKRKRKSKSQPLKMETGEWFKYWIDSYCIQLPRDEAGKIIYDPQLRADEYLLDDIQFKSGLITRKRVLRDPVNSFGDRNFASPFLQSYSGVTGYFLVLLSQMEFFKHNSKWSHDPPVEFKKREGYGYWLRYQEQHTAPMPFEPGDDNALDRFSECPHGLTATVGYTYWLKWQDRNGDRGMFYVGHSTLCYFCQTLGRIHVKIGPHKHKDREAIARINRIIMPPAPPDGDYSKFYAPFDLLNGYGESKRDEGNLDIRPRPDPGGPGESYVSSRRRHGALVEFVYNKKREISSVVEIEPRQKYRSIPPYDGAGVLSPTGIFRVWQFDYKYVAEVERELIKWIKEHWDEKTQIGAAEMGRILATVCWLHADELEAPQYAEPGGDKYMVRCWVLEAVEQLPCLERAVFEMRRHGMTRHAIAEVFCLKPKQVLREKYEFELKKVVRAVIEEQNLVTTYYDEYWARGRTRSTGLIVDILKSIRKYVLERASQKHQWAGTFRSYKTGIPRVFGYAPNPQENMNIKRKVIVSFLHQDTENSVSKVCKNFKVGIASNPQENMNIKRERV